MCLKDLSEDMTAELTSKLRSDPVTLERFYQSFGLDPKKLSARGLRNIGEFFPDTPIKMLKEVFEALKLYDLVELLEKVTKPRTLRPALSLKEIEKLVTFPHTLLHHSTLGQRKKSALAGKFYHEQWFDFFSVILIYCLRFSTYSLVYSVTP